VLEGDKKERNMKSGGLGRKPKKEKGKFES
jgi:hypothetical protein